MFILCYGIRFMSCVDSYIRGNLYNLVSFDVLIVYYVVVKISFCYSCFFIDKFSLFCLRLGYVFFNF